MSTNISWWAQSSPTGPNRSTVHTSTLYNGSGFYLNTSGTAIIWGTIVSWDTDLQPVQADNQGQINGSGMFWQNDSFDPSTWITRRGVWVYALDTQSRTNSSKFHHWSSYCVLSSNDNASTWYERSFTLSGLQSGKNYYVAVGRHDAWEDDWQVTFAFYNLNASYYVLPRRTGLDMNINLYDNQSYLYLGELENVEYGEIGDPAIMMPMLGTPIPFLDYGKKITLAEFDIYPHTGNLSYVNGDLLNYSRLPTPKTIRIWNRSDQNQEVLEAVPGVAQFIFNRDEPIKIKATYFGTNLTNNANFSEGSLLIDSSQGFANKDVSLVRIGDHDLTSLWDTMQFNIVYLPVFANVGNTLSVGGVGHAGAFYTGVIDCSNQSNLIPLIGSAQTVKIYMNPMERIAVSAIIQTVSMRSRGTEVQKRRIEFAGSRISLPLEMKSGLNTSDDWWYATADLGGGGSWFTAQTFTPTETFELSQVKFKVHKDTNDFSPDPTLIAQIRSTNSSNIPTSEILASGSTNANNFTTLLVGSWITVNMSSVLLQQSTCYALVLEPNDWDSFDNYDDGRYVGWRSTLNTATFDGGMIHQSPDYGANWNLNISSRDLMFEIWGY